MKVSPFISREHILLIHKRDRCLSREYKFRKYIKYQGYVIIDNARGEKDIERYFGKHRNARKSISTRCFAYGFLQTLKTGESVSKTMANKIKDLTRSSRVEESEGVQMINLTKLNSAANL